MKGKLLVSVFQSDVVWCNRQKNIQIFENKLKNIKNSDIIILPEMFDTGFCIEPHKIAGENGQETLYWMKSFALNSNISICGSLIFKENERFLNRFYFVTPQQDVFYYDKRHLFGYGGEKNEFSAGNKHTLITFSDWQIFPLICYDLRFPVWARNIHNYNLLIYVANWPDSRIEQWKSLLIARAIENQTYTIGVNRIGTDGNGFVYPGKSLAVNPKGEILYEAKDSEEDLFTVELDLDFLKVLRQKFPVLNDRDEFKVM